MLNKELLLACFPEPPEEFEVHEGEHNLELIHRDLYKYDVEISRLELELEGYYVYLCYVAITEAYQDQGYGRKLLTELFRQCRSNNLVLSIPQAYEITTHIFDSLVSEAKLENRYKKEKCPNEEAWDLLIDFHTIYSTESQNYNNLTGIEITAF